MLAKSAPKVSPKPSLADLSDDLYQLRTLIRQSQEAERKLTAEVLEGMRRVGVDRIEGAVAAAVIGERTVLIPDPALYIEAIGPRGFGALSVSVTVAREFLGEQDLAGISETKTNPVLRVEAKTKVEVAR